MVPTIRKSLNRDSFTSYPADKLSNDKTKSSSETKQKRKQRPRGLSLEDALAYYTDPDTGLWTGSCDSDGYPHIWHQGALVPVHRAQAELAGWPIAEKVIMHIDDNPLNVSLSNLRVGTQRENVADMAAKCRGVAGKANPRITPVEASEIIRRYGEGTPIRQIAQDTGRRRASIRKLIQRCQSTTAAQDAAQATFAFPESLTPA
ncbi:HNH endonuclease [Komagataeibacter xylinus]|uniref:HNH endonuclease signature motif containing protein n=1 Tax=Komagataeibacter xylinus TaxID=28448 RepID=UPI0035B66BC3